MGLWADKELRSRVGAIFGLVLAPAPGARGGMLSILAVILSVIGVIAAIAKAIMWPF